MDLIFADSNKVDIGVMKDFKFDLAYGCDENDFECTVLLYNNQCKEDYILYIEGTEYGGIIDSISPSTEENKIVYSGRTWHGIMNSKVIEPYDGQDYLIVDGDANIILYELINILCLDGLFKVNQEECGIYIPQYKFRYEKAYDGICAMLSSVNAKLKMKWEDGFVLLWVELVNDYSHDEEFDSSQLDFTLKKNFNLCNHLICLGQGDLKERSVIHLFTNENGAVQPYATTETPLQDSDYILDKRNMILSGNDEITEVYDYGSAEITENYIPLTEQPSDWEQNYTSYFNKSGSEYAELEQNIQDVPTLQLIQPYDWGTAYKNYYYLENGEYKGVEDAGMKNYTLLASEPSDWKTNYSNYFYYTDGKYEHVETYVKEDYIRVTSKPADWSTVYDKLYMNDGVEWKTISGDSIEIYVVQTMRPSDWKTNWKDSYCIYMTGDYVKCGDVSLYKKKAPKWRKNTFFNKSSKTVAPKFNKQDVYLKVETPTFPPFVANTYLVETVNNIPAWTQNKYYTMIETDVGIPFVANAYFKKVEDHFASLVVGGIEKLKEIYSSDELEIALDSEKMYDIGDVVGATENMTGIFVSQPIVKKIVTIEKDNESIEYEVKKNGS